MLKNGYIKVFRSLVDWEWYKEPNTCRLFLHILLTANIKKSRFKGIEVPKGGLVTSYTSLAEQTNLTVHQVRTALDHLESTHEISRKVTNKFQLIIVENYTKFQGGESEGGNQVANKWQSSGNVIRRTRRKEEEIIHTTTISTLFTDEQYKQLERCIGPGNLISLIDEIDTTKDISKINDPFAYTMGMAKKKGYLNEYL